MLAVNKTRRLTWKQIYCIMTSCLQILSYGIVSYLPDLDFVKFQIWTKYLTCTLLGMYLYPSELGGAERGVCWGLSGWDAAVFVHGPGQTTCSLNELLTISGSACSQTPKGNFCLFKPPLTIHESLRGFCCHHLFIPLCLSISICLWLEEEEEEASN